MTEDKDIRELLRRKEQAITNMGGPDKIEAQHCKGRMTAPERIHALLDPGSFMELGALAHSERDEVAHRSPGDGKIIGLGTIAGRKVGVGADDVTVFHASSSYVGMKKVERIENMAYKHGFPFIFLGECGGARAIHEWSPRNEQPFVAVNCTALTPELLESELFGHEKGAFTGAIAQKKGKFALADGGTIFLDEIGDLALNLQVKLLRVLQDKEFQRVGGVKDIHVDVRILAATNRDLQQAMRKGTFREDLYYRLNVVALTLPALCDRREDIPALAHYFIAHYCREMNHMPMTIEPDALACLQNYAWPGNVRELQNTIERAVVLSQGERIAPADLPAAVRGQAGARFGGFSAVEEIDESLSLSVAIDEFSQMRIRKALEAAGGNQTEAARRLQLP